MFAEYLDNLRSNGKKYFTFNEVMNDLGASEGAIKSGIYRLKKAGKVISPLKGYYVIMSPEHYNIGSIPAQELVPIMMKQLKAQYYVGLLSAASYHGATHQKVFKFQIITDQRISSDMKFGSVEIEFIHKKSISNLPLQDFVVNTGYLKVASPELTMLDLFKYLKHSGGISHVATVLSELIENVDAKKLFSLAKDTDDLCQIQRIGYVVEQIEIWNEKKKDKFLSELLESLSKVKRPYVALVPNVRITGMKRCKKWRIIENSDFESDL